MLIGSFRLRFWVVFAMLFSIAVAKSTASDVFKLNFIGFSEDGKHLAFQNTPDLVDSDAGPVTLIIDVDRNQYATSEIFDEQLVTTKLKEYKIVNGKHGIHVISHPPTDHGVDYHTVKFTTFEYQLGSADEYKIVLKTIPTLPDNCSPHKDYAVTPISMLEMKLINRSGEEKILQRDKTLPKSRDCPFEYKIEEVYVYNKKIAVFVKVFSPSIEGPSRRYMVITGELN